MIEHVLKTFDFYLFFSISDICREENNRACALEMDNLYDILYSYSYERFKQRDDILMDYSKFEARLSRITSILILIASTKF